MNPAVTRPGAVEPPLFPELSKLLATHVQAKLRPEDPPMTLNSALPQQPDIDRAAIWQQIVTDASGKEVEMAATYSYMWLADEVGHMGLGILLSFGTITLARLLLQAPPDALLPQLVGFLAASAIVAGWEWNSYRASFKAARGSQFPLQTGLLRRDALVATFYMALGAAMGLALHQSWTISVPAILLMIALAFAVAFPWVREKIIWQKAGLPYLSRMADLGSEVMPDAAARQLWQLVETAPPVGAGGTPRHLLIAGHMGSGRTRLAASLGTEHAFRGRSVRYLAFSELVELAHAGDLETDGPAPGPANIGYWRWGLAQVLIIDDIGPFLGALPGRDGQEAIRGQLDRWLKPVQQALGARDTIWLVSAADTDPESHLADQAAALGAFLGRREPPLSILLSQAAWAGLRPAMA